MMNHVCHECRHHYYISDPDHDGKGMMPPELAPRCEPNPDHCDPCGFMTVGLYIHIEKGLYNDTEACEQFELDPEKTIEKQREKDETEKKAVIDGWEAGHAAEMKKDEADADNVARGGGTK